MFINGSGQNVQSLEESFHKFFLSSFSLFGQSVSEPTEEKIFLIDQSETKIAFGGHVCLRIEMKCATFIEGLPKLLPTKFRFICPTVSEEKIFYKSTNGNEKKELTAIAMFLHELAWYEHFYRGPSTDAFYQVSFYLV